MKQEKPLITLIGTGQAKLGMVFIHRGSSQKCLECRYFQVCIKNLEADRVYKIVKVRDRVLPCRLYETNMQVVEVKEAEITTAIPSRLAVDGATITFQKLECQLQNCESYELCFPKGLMDEERCHIIEVTESLHCPLGLSLRKAVLQRVPSS